MQFSHLKCTQFFGKVGHEIEEINCVFCIKEILFINIPDNYQQSTSFLPDWLHRPSEKISVEVFYIL